MRRQWRRRRQQLQSFASGSNTIQGQAAVAAPGFAVIERSNLHRLCRPFRPMSVSWMAHWISNIRWAVETGCGLQQYTRIISRGGLNLARRAGAGGRLFWEYLSPDW